MSGPIILGFPDAEVDGERRHIPPYQSDRSKSLTSGSDSPLGVTTNDFGKGTATAAIDTAPTPGLIGGPTSTESLRVLR